MPRVLGHAASVLVLVVVAVAAGCSSDLPSVDGPCPDVTVVAGSDPIGVTDAITADLEERLGDNDVEVVTVTDYKSGTEGLTASCPETRIGLIGFGEDARKLHAYAAPLETRGTIDFVAMIRDATRTPDDVEEIALARTGLAGDPSGGPGVTFEALRAQAVSICFWRDRVCNARDGETFDDSDTVYLRSEMVQTVTGLLIAKLD